MTSLSEDFQQTSVTEGILDAYTSSRSNNGNNMQSPVSNPSAGNRNVIGVFTSREDAEKAVQELRRQGFTTEEISIITKEDQNGVYDDDISDGVLTGGTIGGIGGLVLGAGAMAIPGIGPILAAGPIAAAIGGAAIGGLAGGLIDWGIPAEDSERYEQSVAQGDILAIVRAEQEKVNQAIQVLRQNGAKDVSSHDVQMR